jgi:hypothetical protein
MLGPKFQLAAHWWPMLGIQPAKIQMLPPPSLLPPAAKKNRRHLRNWRQSLPSQRYRESNVKAVISLLDHIEESRNLSILELSFRRLTIQILQRLTRERVAFWRQMSKIKFTLDGDENTKYFHAVASNRFRNNKISQLQIQGSVFTRINTNWKS